MERLGHYTGPGRPWYLAALETHPTAPTLMLSARSIVEILESQAVTDVVGVPDNSSAALYTLLGNSARIRTRSVTREGEAFSMASGLWMGGRHPVLLIQNTGLLESGDAFRGTAMRMRIPLVCLITYRGYSKMIKNFGQAPPAPDADMLSRSEVDSIGPMTEPTLRAWGLSFEFVHGEGDLPVITRAFERARTLEAPVAALITGDTT
jgi:sulfopyruvate decarboxylase subunit alpha